jgi:hypothetical protein
LLKKVVHLCQLREKVREWVGFVKVCAGWSIVKESKCEVEIGVGCG